LRPGEQLVHSFGLDVEQLAQDLSHWMQELPWSTKACMQEEQTVEDEQAEQPTGQIMGVPPTTLVAMFTEGLFTQLLVELREYPVEHCVQVELLLQVIQLSEQAEQAP